MGTPMIILEDIRDIPLKLKRMIVGYHIFFHIHQQQPEISRCWCRRTTLCWAKVPWWRSRRPACSTWRAGWWLGDHQWPPTTGRVLGWWTLENPGINFLVGIGNLTWAVMISCLWFMGWCSFTAFTSWFIGRSLNEASTLRLVAAFVSAGCVWQRPIASQKMVWNLTQELGKSVVRSCEFFPSYASKHHRRFSGRSIRW